MKVFLMVLVLLTSACASMQDKAFEKVQEGSTEKVLIDVLGSPTFFLKSVIMPGAQAYYYQKGGYLCGFTVKNKIILSRSCVVDNDPKATAADSQRLNNALAIEERKTNLDKKTEDFDPDKYLNEKNKQLADAYLEEHKGDAK